MAKKAKKSKKTTKKKTPKKAKKAETAAKRGTAKALAGVSASAGERPAFRRRRRSWPRGGNG